MRAPTSVRLERPLPAQAGEPLICGEYGPRFIGLGEVPLTDGRPWLPWLLGLGVGATALIIDLATGAL